MLRANALVQNSTKTIVPEENRTCDSPSKQKEVIEKEK